MTLTKKFVTKKVVGKNFNMIRDILCIKLEDVGEFVNKSRDTIRNFELGKKGKIDLELAQEYYNYIRKHLEFPNGLEFENFLTEDLTERLSKIKPGIYTNLATTVLREKQKNHGLYPGLYYLLDDDKMRILCRINEEEIKELKKIRFNDDEPPIWATKQYYIDVLYHVRLAKREAEKKNPPTLATSVPCSNAINLNPAPINQGELS